MESSFHTKPASRQDSSTMNQIKTQSSEGGGLTEEERILQIVTGFKDDLPEILQESFILTSFKQPDERGNRSPVSVFFFCQTGSLLFPLPPLHKKLADLETKNTGSLGPCEFGTERHF